VDTVNVIHLKQFPSQSSPTFRTWLNIQKLWDQYPAARPQLSRVLKRLYYAINNVVSRRRP
jgi:hypothetical protein